MPKRATSDRLADVDVLIVGGGAAGVSTALHLRRINPHVFERTLLLQCRPRRCDLNRSGALTGRADAALDDLGIPISTGAAVAHRVRLVYGGASIEPPADTGAVRIVRRREFDETLLCRATECGLNVVQDVRVLRIERRPNHLQAVTERGSVRAQVVVGCDDGAGAVRRTPWFGPGRMARCYSMETTAPAWPDEPGDDRTLLIDLSYIREGLAGFYWELTGGCGQRRTISRGIVAGSRRGSQAYLEEVLHRRGVDAGGAKHEAWPVRCFDPSESLSWPRVLLAGEAIGGSPLFLDAIWRGLAGGRIAAEAVDEAFRRSDLSFRGYTRRVHRSPLGRELTACARAARWLYGRHSEQVLSLLHDRPERVRMICDGYSGRTSLAEGLSRIGRLVSGPLRRYGRDVRRFRAAATAGSSWSTRPVGDRSPAAAVGDRSPDGTRPAAAAGRET